MLELARSPDSIFGERKPEKILQSGALEELARAEGKKHKAILILSPIGVRLMDWKGRLK